METTRSFNLTLLILLAGAAALIPATGAVLLAEQLREQEHVAISRALKNYSVNLTRRIASNVEHTSPLLERLVERRGAGATESAWKASAEDVRRAHPEFAAIEWADRSMVVRWVQPLVGNEAALGLDLSFEARRKRALQDARDQHRAVITEPIRLVQGGMGFLRVFPVGYGAGFNGYVVAVYSIDEWLGQIFPEATERDFSVSLLHRDAVIYSRPTDASDFSYTQPVLALGPEWTLVLEASAGMLARHRTTATTWVLITGLGLALLVGCLVLATGWARRSAVEAKAAQASVVAALEWQVKSQRQLREAAESVRMSEAKLSSIVANAPLAVALWSPEGRLVHWNEAFADFHAPIRDHLRVGIEFEEVVRLVATARVEAGHAESVEQYVAAKLAFRASPGKRQVRQLPDQRVFVIQDCGLADGGVLETFTDVTELRRQEEAVAIREQLLSDLFQSMDTPAAFFAEDGRMERWNEAFRRAFSEGLRREAKTGGFSAFLDGLGIQAAGGTEPLPDALIGMVNATEVVGNDGANYMLRVTRAQHGLVLLGANITELKEQEFRLRESNRQLEQFAYFASHELQAPLRTVTSMSEFLQADFADSLGSTGVRYLGFVHDAAAHMSSMVTDLLEYSRLSRADVHPKTCPLNDVLDAAMLNLHAEVQASDACIEIEQLPVVTGSRTRLIRLFQNLIQNAIKFRQPDQPLHVRINAQEQGDVVCVYVADNGPGIAHEYQQEIFNPFVRGPADERTGGSGIGLAMCVEIAKQHGGTVTVQSEEGHGSTFCVALKKDSDPEDSDAGMETAAALG